MNQMIGPDEIHSWLSHMAEQLMHDPPKDTAIVGIHTGGVWIAKQLYKQLTIEQPLGELNIAFYRDDFSTIGMHPSVRPSSLPFEVEGSHILLVDDILYTGRTIRAAGYPYGASGLGELPIQADVVGTTLSLPPGEHVKLTGPDPLALVVQKMA